MVVGTCGQSLRFITVILNYVIFTNSSYTHPCTLLNITIANSLTTPPLDAPVIIPPTELTISFSQGGPLFFLAYYMLMFFITLVTGILIIIRRNRPIIRNLSLPFLLLITVGLLLVWALNLMEILEQ